MDLISRTATHRAVPAKAHLGSRRNGEVRMHLTDIGETCERRMKLLTSLVLQVEVLIIFLWYWELPRTDGHQNKAG